MASEFWRNHPTDASQHHCKRIYAIAVPIWCTFSSGASISQCNGVLASSKLVFSI